MDVLELPRPVINFLRTMSKEMHRYSLCWDIYGGSESVTLTLTWKINCDSTSDDVQSDINETGSTKMDTKSPKSPRKPQNKKPQKQFQHSKLDSLKTCSRITSENSSYPHHQRNLSAESDYKKSYDDLNPYYYSRNDNKIHQSRRIADTSTSPVYTTSLNGNSCQLCHHHVEPSRKLNLKKPPGSSSSLRGKSLESYEKKEPEVKTNSILKNQSNTIPISIVSNEVNDDDPWIRRDSYENNKKIVNKSDNEKEKKLMNLIETITSTKNEIEHYTSSRSISNTTTNTISPYSKTNLNSGNTTKNNNSSSSNNNNNNNGASYASSSVLNKVTFDPNLEYI